MIAEDSLNRYYVYLHRRLDTNEVFFSINKLGVDSAFESAVAWRENKIKENYK